MATVNKGIFDVGEVYERQVNSDWPVESPIDVANVQTTNTVVTLSNFTTADLQESPEALYFTVERAREVLVAGPGIGITANGRIFAKGDDTGLGIFSSGINGSAYGFAKDTMANVKAFTNVPSNTYVCYSFLATNLSNNYSYLTLELIQYFDESNVILINQLEMPPHCSLEIFPKPILFYAGDIIQAQCFDENLTPANDLVSLYLSYQNTNDRNYVRATSFVDYDENVELLYSEARISILESILVTNLQEFDSYVSFTIRDKESNELVDLVSNALIPPFSSVEFAEYPKVIGFDESLNLTRTGANIIAMASSKYTSSYDIYSNESTVAEGQSITFYIDTTNLVDNSVIYWEIEQILGNVELKDFLNLEELVGNINIVANRGTLVFTANSDLNTDIEENEVFKINLRKIPGTEILTSSNEVTILDRSNVATYDSIVTDGDETLFYEGDSIHFSIIHPNVGEGSTLYYWTEGNVTNETFDEGNTGTVLTTPWVSNLTLTANLFAIDGSISKAFKLQVAESEGGEPVLTSQQIYVLDESLAFMNAIGGTVIISGTTKRHVFTSGGTFNILRKPRNSPVTISYMVQAGGGGGGRSNTSGTNAGRVSGGGGGAGGHRTGSLVIPTEISTPVPYTITVGGGGGSHTNGSPSSAFGTTSTGGGRGGDTGTLNGAPGGSGGGAYGGPAVGGTGNSPPVSPVQGYNGGTGPGTPSFGKSGSGGGGAGGAGGPGVGAPQPRNGGPGRVSPISPPAYGTPATTFGGGGGGGAKPYPPAIPRGTGGPGGGGAGGNSSNGTAGTANRGAGGGGGGTPPSGTARYNGGAGGSGIVIISYPIAV